MIPLSLSNPSFLFVFRPGKPGLKFFLLVLAAVLTTGCGGRVYLVNSLEPSHAIVVDGDAEDWVGALSYVASEHLFVGFVNDRNDLYICLTKEEAEGRPGTLMGGLTVWLDPAGGQKKTLGIRLAGAKPPGGGIERRPERKPEEESADRNMGEQRPPSPATELEILGPGKDFVARKSLEEAAEEGLEVKTSYSSGSFILEIKIPLGASNEHPLAIGVGPDGIVGVGFVSGRSEEKRMQGRPPGGGMGGGGGQPPGGGMPGGMGGGMGGRPGRMGGGRRPDMNPDIPKALKVWTRVKLAASEEARRSSIVDITAAHPGVGRDF